MTKAYHKTPIVTLQNSNNIDTAPAAYRVTFRGPAKDAEAFEIAHPNLQVTREIIPEPPMIKARPGDKQKAAPSVRPMMRPDLDIPEPQPFPEDEQPGAAPMLRPHNREAEEAVIGCVLIAPEIFPEIKSTLKRSDFFIHKHGWIWKAFNNLDARGMAIDFLTTCEELKRLGQLDEIGGAAYLTLLINGPSSFYNAGAYAQLVIECAARRDLITAAEKIASLAMDPKASIQDVINGSLEAVQSQAQEADKKRYIVRDVNFAMQEQPPIDYLVDGLLEAGSVSIWHGDAGSKKTYSTLSLAVCVASGRPWLDFATKQSPVLFINEEAGERSLTRRIQATLKGELCQDIKIPFNYVSLAGFMLDDETEALKVEREIKTCGARLVIIDALADVMNGDENSTEDTRPVFRNLHKIAERTDSAIVILHHDAKAGGYRGSSHIKGAVDNMVQITSKKGSPFINFESDKIREGESLIWAARATWADGQFDLQPTDISAAPKALSKSQNFVLNYLKEHGASPLPAIMAAADICAPGTARNAAFNLADLKMIRRTNPGEGRAAAIYELVKSES